MSLSQILQSSFRAIYHDQTTIESSKLGFVVIFRSEKFNLSSFFPKFGKLTILVTPYSQIWVKNEPYLYTLFQLWEKDQIYKLFFFSLVIPFWNQMFKIVILWPIPNPSFWCHSIVGSKETQICISNTICENKVIIKVKPKHVILFF